MENYFPTLQEQKEIFHYHSEHAKQVKSTEKIILLVGHANSGKEVFVKYWFEIDILANQRTSAYNKVYVLKDNKTILLFLNLQESNNLNFVFVSEWLKKTKKIKIIVCASINHLIDVDIYFEILQMELDKLPELIRYNKNIVLIVTSDIASRNRFQVNSKELKDLVLEKLQDQEYQSHFSEVFLHKNEAGAFTNIEIFQYSSSDGSVLNRNQIDWFLNKNIQFFKVAPITDIERSTTLHRNQYNVLSFNKRLDALAQSVCDKVISNYNFGTENNLTKLSYTFHRFYKFIESVEFGQIDALPINFLSLLEENNVTIGVHQKQFVNNWEYHSQIILWSIFHKTYAIECKEEAQLKTSWINDTRNNDSSFAASVLKLSIEQKGKLLLWLLFMSVDNKLSARNDQHSKNIRINLVEAINLVHDEISAVAFFFFKAAKTEYALNIALEIIYRLYTCGIANRRAFNTVDLPSDVFIRYIDNKFNQIILDIDNSVETAISKNAEETLQNVVTQIFIDLESKSKPAHTQVTLDFFNKTIIWIDNSQQVFANKQFLSDNFHQWITDNNYTVPAEQAQELLEICRTYSQITKTVEKSVKALKNKPDPRRN
jgi:hypothetical protein